jgi:cardiolipin synthase
VLTVAPQPQVTVRAAAGAASTTQLLSTTDAAIDAIVADIDRATTSVDAEFFALLPDGPGAKLADALERAARRGVHVRLMLDGFGNALVSFGASKRLDLAASQRMLDTLRGAGVELHRAWRFSPKASSRNTDHRKVVAVDGRVAFLGGMNFGRETAGWTDAMVRATGPLAAAVGAEQLRRWSSFDRPDLLPRRSTTPTGPADAVDGYRLLRTSPDERRTDIVDWYVQHINAAQRRVWVASPALFQREIIDALAAAARRGVDVRYYGPGEGLQGIPMLHTLSRAAAAPLVQAGAAVYELNGFAHAKAMVVDEEATVGSFNLTARSAVHDHELNVASADPRFVVQVAGMLGDMQGNSRPAPPLHGLEHPLAWLLHALHVQY